MTRGVGPWRCALGSAAVRGTLDHTRGAACGRRLARCAALTYGLYTWSGASDMSPVYVDRVSAHVVRHAVRRWARQAPFAGLS